MSERVLISTHDLERAGPLRSAFRDRFTVELVTPGEELEAATEPVLLVITDGVEGERVRPLLRQARALDLPVVGFPSPGVRLPPAGLADRGVMEVFPRDAPADEVALIGRRLVERHRLRRITGIVGETDEMREVLERVVQIAPVASTVLVTGESGTGKELVARGLHALSPRKHKPFIAVNVAALSDTLLESELFGHEKGAFTGAIDSRRGFFELAHGGTIFLDEIGEMPLQTQTKLLRVLEQREFLRVGGERPTRVDVRIVAATNRDLRELVATGGFRRDLYYRLNVLRITLPPLRERRDDIPLLVERFIEDISRDNDRPFAGITDEAMEILRSHHWPGNVRELRNLIESMVVLAHGRMVGPEDIPAEVRSGRRDLLPVPIPRPDEEGGGSTLRPQLEFIFRTLVEMRVDMDELKREFEAYRHDLRSVERGRGEVGVLTRHEERPELRIGPEDLSMVEVLELTDRPEADSGTDAGDQGTVVYRPGMTMEDLEREAITAALREVEGNRRKAAERLGIGERTLYRKIKKFGLEE